MESEVANCSSDLGSKIVGAEAYKAEAVDLAAVIHNKTESEVNIGMCRSAAEKVGSEGKHDIVGSEGTHDIVGSQGKHDVGRWRRNVASGKGKGIGKRDR